MEDGVYGQFSHTTQLGEYPEHLHLPRSHSNQNIHQSVALFGIHKPETGKNGCLKQNKSKFKTSRIFVYMYKNKLTGTSSMTQLTLIKVPSLTATKTSEQMTKSTKAFILGRGALQCSGIIHSYMTST